MISDAHQGLKTAISSVLLGAAWQRCRVHFSRNVLARVPKGSAEMVAAAIRTIFVQPSPGEVTAQLDKVAGMLGRQFPKIEEMLRQAAPDLLAFAPFPNSHWREIWSTNPIERVNTEIKRRANAVGIFPNEDAVTRLRRWSSSRSTTSGPSPNGATSPRAPWRSSTRPTRMRPRPRRWKRRKANCSLPNEQR